MNKFIIFFWLSALTVQAQVNSVRVVDRGPNHAVKQFQSVRMEGNTRVTNVSSITVIKAGMHYLEGGVLKESQAKIEIEGDHAVANKGVYSVRFGPDLLAPDAITLQTPDNKILKSHPLALAAYDSVANKSVILGTIQSSKLELVGTNKAIYRSAIPGVDIVYTYNTGSFEQDAILTKSLSDNDLSNLGLNPATTSIEIYSEFSDVPEPQITAGKQNDEHAIVSFGAMKIGWGKGFDLGDRSKEQTIKKQWIQDGERRLLVESISFPYVQPAIAGLEKRTFSKEKPAVGRTFPLLAKYEAKPGNRIAYGNLPSKGYVFDYVNVLGVSSVTFYTGSTYVIDGYVWITDSTTIQNSAIIKATPSSTLQVSTAITFPSSGATPAILTSYVDGTIGEIVEEGVPSSYAATVALALYSFNNAGVGAIQIKNLEVRHASTAITSSGLAQGSTMQSCRFEHCDTAFNAYSDTATVNSPNYVCNVNTTSSGSGITVNSGGFTTNCINYDSDHDGLLDSWETSTFGNLSKNALDDEDGDGVTNLREMVNGTNPSSTISADTGGTLNLKTFTPLKP